MHWLALSVLAFAAAAAAWCGLRAARTPAATLRQASAIDRLIDSLNRVEDPAERHRLLTQLVEAAWQERAAPAMRKVFHRYAARHIAEMPGILPVLKKARRTRPDPVPTFRLLASALEEEGRSDEAMAVAAQAAAYGIGDGNAAGFKGGKRRSALQKRGSRKRKGGLKQSGQK